MKTTWVGVSGVLLSYPLNIILYFVQKKKKKKRSELRSDTSFTSLFPRRLNSPLLNFSAR